MQSSRVKIDTSLIPPADVQNLATTFLEFVKGLCEDSEFMREFEEWKERGEHLKYSL